MNRYPGNCTVPKQRADKKNMPDRYNDMVNMDGMQYLTKNERWTLYDALKECGGVFANDITQEILHAYNDELNRKYRIISENRIIKKYMDIFDFEEAILLRLYEAIDKKYAVNLKMKEGIILRNIFPSKIFLDDDQNRWYLEHIRGGEPFIIWLKKIVNVELLPGINRIKTENELHRENKREILRIKVRVFNEKNSRERAIDFLSEKYIIDEKIGCGYSDITTSVLNIEAFKKWVMEMIPQVLILEPEGLKQEFREMVNSWVKNYAAGI